MIGSLNCIINHNLTCLEALQRLDEKGSNQTLFLVDENKKLVGTVTDGDIRRGLIKGLGVSMPIFHFCNTNFCFVKDTLDISKIRKLKNDGIKILPKLNDFNQIDKFYDLSALNSILPVHVLIMAGGRGERLRPLTDKTPKPMLPLGDKPIIEHNIDRLISYGIESITISVKYLSEQIKSHFGNGSGKGIIIDYIDEENPLGTIGCLSRITDFTQETILVINSDVFTNIDFEEFYLNYNNYDADMAVASIPYSVDIPYAIMQLDDNKIISFQEKPKNTYYANAGIYLVKKKHIQLIPKNSFFNATDLMDIIIQNGGKLIHSPITGYWIDIGKHDDYTKAKELIKHMKNV